MYALICILTDCISLLFSELAVACQGSVKVYNTDTAQVVASFSSGNSMYFRIVHVFHLTSFQVLL